MNRKFSFLFILIQLLFTQVTSGQSVFDFTTQVNRVKHDQNLKTLIHTSLQQPISINTEKEWKKAFWAMELMFYKTSFTKQKLSAAWKSIDSLSESFQKALLEVSYTLYPNLYDKEVTALLQSSNSPSIFIRCAEYLLLSKNKTKYKAVIENLLKVKWNTNDFTGFTILKQRLKNEAIALPPLKEIFSPNFLQGETVIYSLQRMNRNHAGLVIIRKPDGSFVKNKDGSFFQTSQLARAVTNYPFYITNGNTPQGIFRWTGFDTSANSYIGPTTNLQMVMPYESSAEIFFDSTHKNIEWNKELYASLLPASWKNYPGIYESFWAGAIGRSEIIMHGTTINPVYYKGKSYFPQTPSLGCLCSYEEWDKIGKLIKSNQQQIVDVLNNIGSKNGFVVVVDLDDTSIPVHLKEVEQFINYTSILM